MNRKIIFVLLTVFAGSLYAQNVNDIVERSRNRIQADTTQTQSRMIITARGGATTELVIFQYTKNDAQGNHRSVIVFPTQNNPRSVAGIRFMTRENANRANDQWIFTPGNEQVRRLAAAEGSRSFQGTDFSNDDIASVNRRTELDDHRLLREERFNNRDCYVIESVPKDSRYQYSKMVMWVDKENYITLKIELFDQRGTHVKTLEILESRDIQGRLTPVRTRMTTLAAGTNTTMVSEEVRYDANIPETVFTENFLRTGRP